MSNNTTPIDIGVSHLETAHFGGFGHDNISFHPPQERYVFDTHTAIQCGKRHIYKHARACQAERSKGEDVFLTTVSTAVCCAHTGLPARTGTFAHPLGPILCIVITVMLAVAILLIMKYEQKRSNRRLHAEIDLVKNRIVAMSGQPHVIFNSLTAIQELCADNPLKARAIIKDFSSYLHGNLYLLGEETIPFATEMDFCKAYIALEQVGSPSKVDISWQTDRTDFSIAPMAMQTVLEYLLLYGRTAKQDLHMTIHASKKGHGWYVQVKTNAPASCLRENPQAIIDLTNVRNRMRTLCDGDLTARKDTETTVLTLTSARREPTSDHSDAAATNRLA